MPDHVSQSGARQIFENVSRGFGEWFGVHFAKNPIPGLRVIEDRKDFQTATYRLCNIDHGVLSTLLVKAGQNPSAIIEGPTECKILNGRTIEEKLERVVIGPDDQQTNYVVHSPESRKPKAERVPSTMLGEIWQKAGFSITGLIANGAPDSQAAEGILNRVVSALDYTRRFEDAMYRLHLRR